MEDWLDALRNFANSTSRNEAAKAIGYSRTTVSLVLADKYKRDMSKVEAAVRANLMKVDCQITGDVIEIKECGRRKSSMFNYMRCKDCKHISKEEQKLWK